MSQAKPRPDEQERLYGTRPEPLFSAGGASWPVQALLGAIAVAFVWQIMAPDFMGAIYSYGFIPAGLSEGRWGGLLTHIFLHGGWLHLIMNATALLAFGAPVARLFGSGPLGGLRFLSFFLVTGVLAGLGYWAVHPEGTTPLVGASGAISGLMGGAARLLAVPGRVGSPFSGPALRFILPWVVINLLIGLVGSFPRLGLLIAWEAHLAGLAAGLLLIGLFAARRTRERRARR